ncbi:MAG: AMP-binding protein, partial [Bacteroidota bacterium]
MAESNEILLQADAVYEAPAHITERARISAAEYESMYARSIADPEAFWAEIADQELEFFQKWDKVREWDYPNYKWFTGAKLNITHNCLDRHVRDGKGARTAYIYNNENGEEATITYAELLHRVKKMANALEGLGLQKGDRVAFYMPLTIEQIVAILACARIGAIHSIIFAGFSANALRMRVEDAEAKIVFSSTSTQRRGKRIDLQSVTDEAVDGVSCVEHVIVHVRNGDQHDMTGRQKDYQALLDSGADEHEAPALDAEDPLFILYTSGTTGKPKGVLHTTAGYNLYTHYTTKITFDLHEDDVFWCTADSISAVDSSRTAWIESAPEVALALGDRCGHAQPSRQEQLDEFRVTVVDGEREGLGDLDRSEGLRGFVEQGGEDVDPAEVGPVGDAASTPGAQE